MTKSTITRERLEELAAGQSGFNLRIATHEESQELSRIALAAMDGEPVAYIGERVLEDMAEGYCGRVWPFNKDELSGESRIPLYRHAQPAPVVPEEATPDSIEILASARRRDRTVFQWDEDQRNAAADSWNACRAAMLNGGKP